MRAVLLLPLCLAACAAPAEPGAADAGSPLARLVLPRLGDLNQPLAFDASHSQSPAGILTHRRFSFGDGAALQDSGEGEVVVRHAYAQEGVFAISLEVEDVQGRSARVQGQLTVRQNTPLCHADSDCQPLDRCIESLCNTEISSGGPP